MKKTAIILGATGLTGSLVLEQLLTNDQYDCIKLFSRKTTGVTHPKVKEYLGDILDLESFSFDFTGDEVYVCIGTTKKKTPDRSLYRSIDFGIPVAAAKLAKANNIPAIAVVSAIGADSKSSFEYNRIKGDMETGVQEAGVTRTYFVRPSLITGNRQENRGGEKFSIVLFKLLRPIMIGKLKRYRAVEASAIAAKLIALINSGDPSQTIESEEIT